MSKYKPKGWRGEPHRHYLAAKGIKTKNDYFQKKRSPMAQSEASKIFSRGMAATARREKRRSLLAPARVQEEQQRAALAGAPQLKGSLTKEEAAEVEQKKDDLGVKGVTEGTAWRFWQPKDTIKAYNKLREERKIVRRQVKKLNETVKDSDTPKEVREKAAERADELEKRTDEIEKSLVQYANLLDEVKKGKRPKDFDIDVRKIFADHAIQSGRVKV